MWFLLPISWALLLFLLFLVILCVFLVVSTLRGYATVRDQTTLAVAAILVTIFLSLVFYVVPKVVDETFNNIEHDVVLPPLSEDGKALHQSLFVVDMHADTLLWDQRDMLQKNNWGHVDVPRLIEGGVALQAFTIVTQSPHTMSFNENKAPNVFTDLITPLVIASRWNLASLTSLAARTLYQINKLKQAVKNSHSSFFLIETKKDLNKYTTMRNSFPLDKKNITAALIGIEGLHALDDDLDNIDVFYREGVRMMGFAHFFDNSLAGSAHGVTKGGLTTKGIEALRRMENLGIVADVAHASEAVISDISKYGTKPFLSSHTGVQAVCPSPRNLADEHLRMIAKSGGLISITFFRPCMCGTDTFQSIIDSIAYVKKLVGVEHIALGSDFDGFVKTPFDATGFGYLTEGLLKNGFSTMEIQAVMGGNAKKFWETNLPS